MKKQIGPKAMILPMPALLVGTYSEDGTPSAMTAAWTGVCCHRPPCVGVAVRHNRFTFGNLQRKKAFTLNIPSTKHATQVDYLGMISGEDEPNKLEIAQFHGQKGLKVDAPLIAECAVNLECVLVDRLALGSHSWFVGEVKEVHVDEEILQSSGALDVVALDPLVYETSSSQYYSFGSVIGQAFSIGKSIKKG